jgi:hypothetical protein
MTTKREEKIQLIRKRNRTARIQGEKQRAKDKKRREEKQTRRSMTQRANRQTTRILMQKNRRTTRTRRRSRTLVPRLILPPQNSEMTDKTKLVIGGGDSQTPTKWEIINGEIANEPKQHRKVNIFITNIISHKSKRSNISNKTVYGKVWMNGCGHCDNVRETWIKVVESLDNNDNYVNVDILNTNIESGSRALQQLTGGIVNADGFPTFYKIKNRQVSYYSGDRSISSFKTWLL